jgi:predicted PurR-regulated permease PerM
MSELEKTVGYIRESVFEYRVKIFWIVLTILFVFLAVQVREITTLLVAAYIIALTLDPIVTRLAQLGMRRGFTVIALGGFFFLLTLVVLFAGIPSLLTEFEDFAQKLPGYLEVTIERSSETLGQVMGVQLPSTLSELPGLAKEYLQGVGGKQFATLAGTGARTLLKGYSLALTVFNLFLLPFFVFYFTRDLHKFHSHIRSLLSDDVGDKISKVGSEILQHVYAFLRGQITVCLILALLYSLGLLFVGLPSAIAVGTLAGLLNIIPYFGLAIGLILASLLTFVHEPSLWGFAKVFGVFIVVQGLEGTLITPKIVGESVGIHPLVVMVALIVGGQLFGLIGLLIAIPVAASLRVVSNRLLETLEEVSDDDVVSDKTAAAS